MSKFLQLLNWRLIVIHLVAFWFIYHGVQTIAFCKDPPYGDFDSNAIIKVYQKFRFDIDKNFIEQMGNIGLILAYVLAWYVSWKKGWHWINDVFAFVIAFALGYFYFLGWNNLPNIFFLPGDPFYVTRGSYHGPSIWSYMIDGAIMLALGVVLLFWGKIQQFIDRGQYVDKVALEAAKKKQRVK